MPDISMCFDGDKCERKHECYRYMAIPNGAEQSYIKFAEQICVDPEYKEFESIDGRRVRKYEE